MTPSPLPVFFGSYDRIIDAAASLIADRRKRGGVVDWLRAPTELIVPSSAVANALAAAIVEKTGGTAGVRIEPLDRLAMRILSLADKSSRVAAGEERTLAMQLSVKSAALPDEIFAAPGIVALLERSYRDAVDSGVTLTELRKKAHRHPHPERFASVLAVWDRHEQLLTAGGGVDPAWLLQSARQLIPASPIPPQILFGFYDVTQLQERFLRSLKEAGKVESIYFPFAFEGANPTDAYAFANRLTQRLLDGEQPVAVNAEPPAVAELAVMRRTTRSEEHDAVCASIAHRLESGAPVSSIGAVKRMLTPLDVDLLQRSAHAHGFTFNRNAPRPIMSTRVGRVVLLLLDLPASGFLRDSVVELAAAGVKNKVMRNGRDAERTDEISRLCGIVRGNAAEAERAVSASRYSERESARDYIAFVRELETMTRNVPDDATAADWKRVLGQLLETIDAASEADLAAAAAIDELGETVARFPAATFSRSEISTLLREKQIESEPDRSGVWLSDIMHARGRTFDHLYLIGTEDDQLPQRRSDDPLLPDATRDHFGVRQIGDGEEEERFLFRLMRDSALLTFTASLATAEQGGRLRRPSRLLVQMAIERFPDERGAIVSDFAGWAESRFDVAFADTVVTSRLAALLGGGPRGAGASRPREDRNSEHARAGGPRSSATSPGLALQQALRLADGVRRQSSYDGYVRDRRLNELTKQKLAHISPTRLERFGDCPQKFLFTSLLNVKELETPELEVEMEAKKRGILQHRILEEFYQSLDENDYNRADTTPFARLSAELASRLRRMIDAQLNAFDAGHPPANPTMRELDREKIQKNLNRFVGLDLADLARNGFRPTHFEFTFGDDEGKVAVATLQLGDVTLSIRGTIDRVDQSVDGRVRVVDYKSGTASYLDKIGDLAAAGRALQLPLYALAWSQLFSVPVEKIDGCIRPLASSVVDDKDLRFNLGELHQTLIETLSLFTGAITQGNFPAFPGGGCRFCAVNHSCRALFDAQERLLLSKFKNPREYLVGAAPE